MASPSLIELLEPRIAPATFVNAFVVTYADVDGDLVKVKSSKPIFHDDLREFTFTPAGEGEELSELLLNPSASGSDLKVKVIETSASGDGAVNVGFIQASGVDLRSVTIEGALGRISVGDDDPTMQGIGVLHVGSLGLESQGVHEESSNLVFGAGVVRIEGDLAGTIVTPDTKPGSIGRLFVGGDLTGSVIAQRVVIGKIQVEGDLVGSEDGGSGWIIAKSIEKIVINGSVIEGRVSARKEIGSAVVEGNIEGGDGDDSGWFSSRHIASFWLGGSLIGGRGESSGIITGDRFDLLVVNGSILGGSGDRSGRIAMYGAWDLSNDADIKIGGDLVGGTGAASGSVLTQGQRIVNVAVGGDVSGSSGSIGIGDYDGEHAGSIFGHRLGKVTIGGSIIAAERPAAEGQITSYAIWAKDSIEKLEVGGSVEGTSNNRLGISAGGKYSYSGYDPTALLGTMTVNGSVTYAEVSAGYYALVSRKSFNADARIGEVRINGDLTASSITAGIHPGADARFGSGDDHTQEREATERRSRITSIIVGGQVTGTSAVGDAFGIAAQRILSMTIGGVAVPLKSGLDTIQLAANTGDVLLREHAK